MIPVRNMDWKRKTFKRPTGTTMGVFETRDLAKSSASLVPAILMQLSKLHTEALTGTGETEKTKPNPFVSKTLHILIRNLY